MKNIKSILVLAMFAIAVAGVFADIDPKDKSLDGTAWCGKNFGLYFKDGKVYWVNKGFEYRTELPLEKPQRMMEKRADGPQEKDDSVPAIVYSHDQYGEAVGLQIKSVSGDVMELQQVSIRGLGSIDGNVTLKKQDKQPGLFDGVYFNGKKLQGMWWCNEHNVGVYFKGDKAYFVEKDYTYSDESELDFSKYGTYARLPKENPAAAGHIEIQKVERKTMTAEYWFTHDIPQPPAMFVLQKKLPEKK